MRNAWVTVDIDGRATQLSGGPRAIDGGLDATFRMREHGGSVPALSVRTFVSLDRKTLDLVAYDNKGKEIYRHTTQR
jgi:hypothetical protein